MEEDRKTGHADEQDHRESREEYFHESSRYSRCAAGVKETEDPSSGIKTEPAAPSAGLPALKSFARN